MSEEDLLKLINSHPVTRRRLKLLRDAESGIGATQSAERMHVSLAAVKRDRAALRVLGLIGRTRAQARS